MVTCRKPQQWKKEENERLRGERDQINFIYLRFERWQALGFGRARRGQDVPIVLVKYVEGRPWRPIQSPSNERKGKGYEERLILDLKGGQL